MECIQDFGSLIPLLTDIRKNLLLLSLLDPSLTETPKPMIWYVGSESLWGTVRTLTSGTMIGLKKGPSKIIF